MEGVQSCKGTHLTGERSLLRVMALEGDPARSIGDIIRGNRKVVGDLLYDECRQITSVRIRLVTMNRLQVGTRVGRLICKRLAGHDVLAKHVIKGPAQPGQRPKAKQETETRDALFF